MLTNCKIWVYSKKGLCTGTSTLVGRYEKGNFSAEIVEEAYLDLSKRVPTYLGEVKIYWELEDGSLDTEQILKLSQQDPTIKFFMTACTDAPITSVSGLPSESPGILKPGILEFIECKSDSFFDRNNKGITSIKGTAEGWTVVHDIKFNLDCLKVDNLATRLSKGETVKERGHFKVWLSLRDMPCEVLVGEYKIGEAKYNVDLGEDNPDPLSKSSFKTKVSWRFRDGELDYELINCLLKRAKYYNSPYEFYIIVNRNKLFNLESEFLTEEAAKEAKESKLITGIANGYQKL